MGENKTVVILEHGNRLANQLWNLIGIYAYCLERGYAWKDLAARDYLDYFESPHNIPSPIRYYFNGVNSLLRLTKGGVFRKRFIRGVRLLMLVDLTNFLLGLIPTFKPGPVIQITNKAFTLPPSVNRNPHELDILERAEVHSSGYLYFKGWLFRNPVGIIKHRDSIIRYLKVKDDILDKVGHSVGKVRVKFPYVVGVHYRQGDFGDWLGGKFSISPVELRAFMERYLTEFGRSADSTSFILCSDGSVSMDIFDGLNVQFAGGSEIEDLLILSSCDMILGSNSTFGGFASYYGNTPLIIFQKEMMDWDYYKERSGFFEDKYFQLNNLPGADVSESEAAQFFAPKAQS